MTSTTANHSPERRSVSLGIDVGGTKIAAGLVAPDGSMAHHREWPTATADRMRDPGLAGTALAVRRLLADARDLGFDVTGVGVGLPEYVDAEGVLTSREVLAWDEQPADVVAAELKAAELPGLPYAIGSDVRCGALGEAVHGAGRELPDFLYVSLGTGLSSAFVLGGRPWPGARGEAIALGEFEVSASVDAAFGGNLERFTSGRGIGDRYTAATGRSCPGAREVTASPPRGRRRPRRAVVGGARPGHRTCGDGTPPRPVRHRAGRRTGHDGGPAAGGTDRDVREAHRRTPGRPGLALRPTRPPGRPDRRGAPPRGV